MPVLKKECPEKIEPTQKFFNDAFVIARKRINDVARATGNYIIRSEGPVLNKIGVCLKGGVIVLNGAIDEDMIIVLRDLVKNQCDHHMNIAIHPVKDSRGELKLGIYFEPMER